MTEQELREKIARLIWMNGDENDSGFRFLNKENRVFIVANQILTLIKENYVSKEEIEKLEVIKLKKVPKQIYDYHRDTIHDKANYVAGFEDGKQAQLQDVKDTLLGKKG